jgi:hypothetical protein
MTLVAKLDGKIVQIVKFARDVGFSKDKDGWILINCEVAKPNSLAVKWVPASTRFDWVKDFNFN